MAVDVNAAYAECPVCYDDLFKEPQAVFVRHRRRTCRHFYHHKCAELVIKRSPLKSCPICRVDFDGLKVIPDPLIDPDGWFATVDMNGDGRLDKKEVLEVLKSTLSVDEVELERGLDSMWRTWDHDNSGFIEKRELLHPTRGLLSFVRTRLPRKVDRGTSAPRLTLNTEVCKNWFLYWDDNRSGTLELDEVIRAIVKTYKLSSHGERLEMVRSIVSALWIDFDPDGDGHITLQEFCQRGGLAEMVIANCGSSEVSRSRSSRR